MQEPSTLAEVIAHMQATLKPLRASDGVACFTSLYLEVTQGVEAHLARVVFADSKFLARLDVVFANLFLAALQADAGRVPHAWAPLIQLRSARGIAPLQFALAGMSAHINRDLPVALVATCREHGVAVEEGSPQHTDFERVNGVLAAVEEKVKARYLTGWLRTVDRLVHRVNRLDDVVAMWNVRRARDAAWANAEALWALRDQPALSDRYVLALDRMVGLTARGLLVPADTALQKLGRFLTHR